MKGIIDKLDLAENVLPHEIKTIRELDDKPQTGKTIYK